MQTGEKSKFKGGGTTYPETAKALASQWGCSPRHASKIRRGVATAKCTGSCGCPVAMKALEAATKPVEAAA